MKPKVKSVASLVGIILLHLAALGQTSTPQQTMTVLVVNAHLQPSQPVQSLRVFLSYLDGASRITDAREVTNRHGQAFLQALHGPTLQVISPYRSIRPSQSICTSSFGRQAT